MLNWRVLGNILSFFYARKGKTFQTYLAKIFPFVSTYRVFQILNPFELTIVNPIITVVPITFFSKGDKLFFIIMKSCSDFCFYPTNMWSFSKYSSSLEVKYLMGFIVKWPIWNFKRVNLIDLQIFTTRIYYTSCWLI